MSTNGTANQTHIDKDSIPTNYAPKDDLIGKAATNTHFMQTLPYPTYQYGVTTTPSPTPLKLYKKIHSILKKGIRVGKNGTNTFHKYDYVTEADVVDEMKRIFTENNLVYDFNIVDVSQVVGLDNVTQVTAKITLIDLDSGESKEYTFVGVGQDKGDKGLYKAYTGLQKYFFMKNFLISTGDDPEYDGQAPKTSTKSRSTTQTTETIKTESKSNGGANTTVLTGSTSVASGTTTNVTVGVGGIQPVTANGADNVTTTTTSGAAEVTKKPRSRFSPPKRTSNTDTQEE
jgi:hypothetical protein